MSSFIEENTTTVSRRPPRIDIRAEQVEYLVENGKDNIAAILDCSTRTVERSMREFQISPERNHTPMGIIMQESHK